MIGGARLALMAAAGLCVVAFGPFPAAAQQGVMRSQTEAITGAVRQQQHQATRPGSAAPQWQRGAAAPSYGYGYGYGNGYSEDGEGYGSSTPPSVPNPVPLLSWPGQNTPQR